MCCWLFRLTVADGLVSPLNNRRTEWIGSIEWEGLAVPTRQPPDDLLDQLMLTIENLMGSVRELGRRMKRWRDARMIVRWTVTAVADAATHFRRIAGARAAMSKLVVALRTHDSTSSTVESRTRVAWK